MNSNFVENFKILKKSVFYYYNDKLREHIATYNGYAILIKQECINNSEPAFSIIKKTDLQLLKKVNGNIIRKINPSSFNVETKTKMLFECIEEISKL